MKVRAVILAGGEGARLGVLTEKRTKPAVPFGGKYRIIDFVLSNCVNSDIFDIMLIAQYRPQSLIEHIGAGGPWDLNRDFTGGVRIFTPFKARRATDWFAGTADALQQNFTFIKRNNPELVILLGGDHIYAMDYEPMVTFHLDHQAEMTMATIQVPAQEAPRFGIVGLDENYRINSFVEKPKNPPSNLANMGVYIFNLDTLDKAIWEDHLNPESNHDIGRDVIPTLLQQGAHLYAYPYTGYWVDVGTVYSYWHAHMDLIHTPPLLDLNNRSWIIHTRTEERPPSIIQGGAIIENSMVSDGCVIEKGAVVKNSVLSPGVHVCSGSHIEESILLTDAWIDTGGKIQRAILDKEVHIGPNGSIGGLLNKGTLPILTMVGKNCQLPSGLVVEPGATIWPSVVPSDLSEMVIHAGENIRTRRQPYEI